MTIDVYTQRTNRRRPDMAERINDTNTDKQGKSVGESGANKSTQRPLERKQDTSSKVRDILDGK